MANWWRVGVSLAAVAGVALWLAALIHVDYGDNWSALFCIGEHAPMPLQLAPGAYRWKGADGYDGQYYRYVAHDPLFRKGYAQFIDAPRIRYRRILIPGLAYLLAFGRSQWIDAAYIVLELIAVGLGVYWSSAYLAMRGRHPLWGILFVLMPGALSSFDRMLADGLLTALFVGFLYYSETQAWNKAYAVTVLAGLTRETGLFMAAGAVAFWLFRRQFRRALLFSTAVAPAFLWYAFVSSHTAPGEPLEILAWPGVGLVRRIFTLLAEPGYPLNALVVDTLSLVGLIVCIPLALHWIWHGPLSAGGLTIVLFAGLALVLGSPSHLTESYGYSRPVSPLLAFVALQAIACGAWTALAFPFFVCLSVGLRVISIVRIMDILRGL
jgi:hypothetical protein